MSRRRRKDPPSPPRAPRQGMPDAQPPQVDGPAGTPQANPRSTLSEVLRLLHDARQQTAPQSAAPFRGGTGMEPPLAATPFPGSVPPVGTVGTPTGGGGTGNGG